MQKQYDPIKLTDDSRLVNIDNCKYLDVYIDKDLKWTDHCFAVYHTCEYVAYNTLPIPQLHSQQLLSLAHKCKKVKWTINVSDYDKSLHCDRQCSVVIPRCLLINSISISMLQSVMPRTPNPLKSALFIIHL